MTSQIHFKRSPETPYDLEQRLFEEALDHPAGAERDAFIKSACAHDPELEISMLRLLASDDEASAFFENISQRFSSFK